jgi:hypothetical protein
VRRLDDALPLGLALGAQLGLDLGALLLGLLAEPGGLVPGLGQLRTILLQRPLRLGLGLI